MQQQLKESEIAVWLPRLFALGLAAAAAFLLVHFLDLVLFAVPDHDQSWLLYAAERVAAGVQLDGPRLVETNPPLAVWFSLIPVALAHLFRTTSAFMLNLYTGVLMLGSALWSGRLLHRAGFLKGPLQLFLGVSATLLAESLITGAEIGQREQFLVILLVPYLLSAASGATTRLPVIERCALGIVAGIGVCLKPQEILALFCFEIVLAFGIRSLRRLYSPDFLSLFLTACGYLLLVRLTTAVYITHTVPLLKATYWAFGEDSISTLVRNSPGFNIAFLAAIAAWFFLRNRLRNSKLPLALLGCTIGALLAYFQQHTGWGNHQFPQIAFLVLAICTMAIDLFSPSLHNLAQHRIFGIRFFATATLCTLILLPIVIIHHRRVAFRMMFNKGIVEDTLASYPAGTPVYVLSTGLDGFPPVLQHHLIWASRYVHLWMLPALAKNDALSHGGPVPKKVLTPEVIAQISTLQRREMVEDLQSWKPAVVIVKLCRPEGICQAMTGVPFDMLGWFLKDSAFTVEWANYRKQTGNGYYDVYTRIQ